MLEQLPRATQKDQTNFKMAKYFQKKSFHFEF